MDQRQWTPQHLQAANMAHPSLLALTPPQGEELSGVKDVDVRGPGKFWAKGQTLVLWMQMD